MNNENPFIFKLTIGEGDNDKSKSCRSFVVERNIGRPDIATIELTGVVPRFSLAADVKIWADDTLLYSGELVSIAPTYGGKGEKHQTTQLIAMNCLHRFNRGRRSVRLYKEQMNEKDIVARIVEEVAKDRIKKIEWIPEQPEFHKTIQHEVVLWTNQTAMEFLGQRAHRYGYHVWCFDTTLYCAVPDFSKQSGFELHLALPNPLGKQLRLSSFLPRMSTVDVVSGVEVTASDPLSGKPNQGRWPSASLRSHLGDTGAVDACREHGRFATSIVDVPATSTDEADVIARAQFQRQSLTFITAQADLIGSAARKAVGLELGETVEVAVASEDDPFNGRYYVEGITHRYAIGEDNSSKVTSHMTTLSLARDAHSGKRI
jgi:hypothetical protein